MTSFVFRVRNLPAALYKALGGFATNGVNMTKLESYMVEGQFFATQFYAEVDGHPEDIDLKRALEELAYLLEGAPHPRRLPGAPLPGKDQGTRVGAPFAASGVRICSGRNPKPIRRAGIRRRTGRRAKIRSTQCGVGFARLPSVGPMMRCWTST